MPANEGVEKPKIRSNLSGGAMAVEIHTSLVSFAQSFSWSFVMRLIAAGREPL